MSDQLDEKIDEFLKAVDVEIKEPISATTIIANAEVRRFGKRARYTFWSTSLAIAASLLLLFFVMQSTDESLPLDSVALVPSSILSDRDRVLLEDVMFFSNEFEQSTVLLDDEVLNLFVMLHPLQK